MSAKIVDWKGREVLEITEEGFHFPVRLGKRKAQAIARHLEDLLKFAELGEWKKEGKSL